MHVNRCKSEEVVHTQLSHSNMAIITFQYLLRVASASSTKDYELMTTLKLGGKMQYAIPSFPVFTKVL